MPLFPKPPYERSRMTVLLCLVAAVFFSFWICQCHAFPYFVKAARDAREEVRREDWQPQQLIAHLCDIDVTSSMRRK